MGKKMVRLFGRDVEMSRGALLVFDETLICPTDELGNMSNNGSMEK